MYCSPTVIVLNSAKTGKPTVIGLGTLAIAVAKFVVDLTFQGRLVILSALSRLIVGPKGIEPRFL